MEPLQNNASDPQLLQAVQKDIIDEGIEGCWEIQRDQDYVPLIKPCQMSSVVSIPCTGLNLDWKGSRNSSSRAFYSCHSITSPLSLERWGRSCPHRLRQGWLLEEGCITTFFKAGNITYCLKVTFTTSWIQSLVPSLPMQRKQEGKGSSPYVAEFISQRICLLHSNLQAEMNPWWHHKKVPVHSLGSLQPISTPREY